MIIRSRPGLMAMAAAGLAALAALQASPAAAQVSWDWGGDSVLGGSGRKVVDFSTKYATGEIIVSFTDRKLYFISRPGEAISYPIAVPREQSRWQGVTSVSQKRVNPSWTPTPTMIAENPRLPRWVPGGHPLNPLGVRALYLGNSMYRIHGTDAPWTIGTAVSKGCIRLYNQDVLDLYPRVKVGAKVTVTWQAFTGGTAISKAPVPKDGMIGAPNTSFFLFDDDEPPAKAHRRRPARTKAKREAAVEASANVDASKAPATQNVSAETPPAADRNEVVDRSPPMEKGPSSTSSATPAAQD
jgi:lipoprotein-anchoring transpeptidase ErfK/SrfK